MTKEYSRCELALTIGMGSVIRWESIKGIFSRLTNLTGLSRAKRPWNLRIPSCSKNFNNFCFWTEFLIKKVSCLYYPLSQVDLYILGNPRILHFSRLCKQFWENQKTLRYSYLNTKKKKKKWKLKMLLLSAFQQIK